MSKDGLSTSYTVERVALMLHVSPDLVIKAIRQGKLKAKEDSGSYAILEENMRKFMKHGNPFSVSERVPAPGKAQKSGLTVKGEALRPELRTRLYRQLAAEEIPLIDNPFKSELSIESFLIDNQHVLALHDDMRPRILTSQLPVLGGRKTIGTNGRIDVLCTLDNMLGVVEVKNGTLCESHLAQLSDYLNAFEPAQVKDLMTEEFSEYENAQVVGILVGTAIDEDLQHQIEKKRKPGDQPIYAITLNRYSSEAKDENYFVAQYHEPRKLRSLPDFQEFVSHLRQATKVQQIILDAATGVHDFLSREYGPGGARSIYRPTGVFTYNVPKRQKKRMFAYVLVQNKAVRLEVTNRTPPLSAQPVSGYPDLYYFRIRTPGDISEDIKQAIGQSYEIISQ